METDLQMVRRHVRDGEAHLKRQRAVVLDLQERGAPTETALALLDQFEDLQRQHKEHLARLEGQKPNLSTNDSH